MFFSLDDDIVHTADDALWLIVISLSITIEHAQEFEEKLRELNYKNRIENTLLIMDPLLNNASKKLTLSCYYKSRR